MTGEIRVVARRSILDRRVEVSARAVGAVFKLTGAEDRVWISHVGIERQVLDEYVERSKSVIRRMLVLVVTDERHRNDFIIRTAAKGKFVIY